MHELMNEINRKNTINKYHGPQLQYDPESDDFKLRVMPVNSFGEALALRKNDQKKIEGERNDTPGFRKRSQQEELE